MYFVNKFSQHSANNCTVYECLELRCKLCVSKNRVLSNVIILFKFILIEKKK